MPLRLLQKLQLMPKYHVENKNSFYFKIIVFWQNLLWHYIIEIEHFMFPYVFNPKDLPNTFIYNFIFSIILPSSNQPQRKLGTPKKIGITTFKYLCSFRYIKFLLNMVCRLKSYI